MLLISAGDPNSWRLGRIDETDHETAVWKRNSKCWDKRRERARKRETYKCRCMCEKCVCVCECVYI